MIKKEQNLNNIENPKLDISDVIHSNMVDGKLDAVSALQYIFDEECAKALLKTIIEENGGDEKIHDVD